MAVAFEDAKDRIIVALDLSTVDDARAMIEQLDDAVTFYKIGYKLGYAGGFSLVPELQAAGKRIFLDLKLLDIDAVVAGGVASLAAMGADFVTVHAYPKAMKAAAQAAQGSKTTILGVTVLTSMSDRDLDDAGYTNSASELVLKRAAQAKEAGIGGLVCSALEVAAIRREIGTDLTLVTPGIRPAGSAVNDQMRIATPASAVADGSDYLVIGRPITGHSNPRAAAQEIAASLAN